MKLTRVFVTLALNLSLGLTAFLALPTRTAVAQDDNAALQRGYRTGYSDGYMAGYRDTIDSLSKDLNRHTEYSDATRAYNSDYGSREIYRDGYRQGFETGYETGFEKRSFDGTVPAGLTPRAETQANLDSTTAASTQTISYAPDASGMIVIPRETEMIIELQNDLGTETNKVGDKFTARVVSPAELSGGTIEGRIDKIQKPGRLKRRSELSLSFDRIVFRDERWSNFSAILTEVLPVQGDNVRRVDSEGTAIGKSSIKSDSVKVGGATGGGLIIGAITGGPVGAAIGAGVGAAFGVGAVVIQRGKHVRLNQNQQLRIRTAYETRIR